jgi:predicted RNase H-like nuclease
VLAGVDGHPRGWIAALDPGHGPTTVELFPTFADLLARPDLTLIVVDMPIGLLDRGDRQADRLARQRLDRSRKSSVFPAPLRAMLAARDWAEAAAIRQRLDGKRCAHQVFGLIPKIREVDALLTPALQSRVVEGHPEVCLATLAAQLDLPRPRHRKTTPEGRAERLALLRPVFPELDAHLAARRFPGAAADILDAHACLWTARRLVAGIAERLPAVPELDARGLHCEIVV